MKRDFRFAFLVGLCLTLLPSVGLAIPSLQLDVVPGGVYADGTTFAETDSFTLRALLLDDGWNSLADTYYLSIAMIPPTTTTPTGTFLLNGKPVDVSTAMTYGTPPISLVDVGGTLPTHGVYPNYFMEYTFRFDPTRYVRAYDVQTDALGSIHLKDYYVDIPIDIAGFAGDLHFDLYNTIVHEGGTILANSSDEKKGHSFAPFSHDAQTRKVPEPGVLPLVGMGLLAMTFYVRRRD